MTRHQLALGAFGCLTFLTLAGIRAVLWPGGLRWLILAWLVIVGVTALVASSPPPDCGHGDCTQRQNQWHRHEDRAGHDRRG